MNSVFIKLNRKPLSRVVVEAAVAHAFLAGVRAGVEGARGEKISKSGVLIYETASIENDNIRDIIHANAAAIGAMPVHKMTTEQCFK